MHPYRPKEGKMNQNLQLWRQHLVGRSVAFRNQNLPLLSKIYHGVIADVIDGHTWLGQQSVLFVPVDCTSCCHLRLFFLGDSSMYGSKLAVTDENEPWCSEPIIDGAIPLNEFIQNVIIPALEAE